MDQTSIAMFNISIWPTPSALGVTMLRSVARTLRRRQRFQGRFQGAGNGWLGDANSLQTNSFTAHYRTGSYRVRPRDMLIRERQSLTVTA
jgi:hypothetical protein